MNTKYIARVSYLGWIFILYILSFLHLKSMGETISHQAIIMWDEKEVSDIINENGKSYTKVCLPNSVHDVVPGKPDIPYVEYGFLVPDGAGEFSVSLCDVVIQDSIELNSPLIPSQLIWSVNDLSNKPFLDTDTDIYNFSSGIQNGEIMDEIYVNGQYHVVKVAVPTMEYNPITKAAKLYASLRVDLHYKTGINPNLSISDTYEVEDCYNLKDVVVNPPKSYLPRKENLSNQLSASAPEWYYIVTPSSLFSSAKRIGDWKKQKGYNVEIVTVEEILNSSAFNVNGVTIVDNAESVRKWLISERKKVGSFYLLFIGDSRTSSPIRKLRYGEDYNEADVKNWISGQFIPTDGYFSDITTDYKLTKEADGHYSAFVEKVAFSPDLYVGRILASRNQEINTYFDKLLTYELLPNNTKGRYDYLSNGLVTQQYQHLNYTSLFDRAVDFPHVSTLRDTKGYTDYTKSTPIGEEVILNMGGCGLMSLMGHGGPTTIACSGGNYYPDPDPITGKKKLASEDWRYIQSLSSYSSDLRWIRRDEPNNGLNLLRNEGKPSIIYTLSCDVMPFDSLFNVSKGSGFLPYNMAEAFTIAGNFGGVAFIGNTRTGKDGSSKTMELSFGNQINKRATIGKAFNSSALSISDKYAQYSRNIIGDPELKIWMGEPTELDLNISQDTSGVFVSGDELPDAKIVVYDGTEFTSYKVGSSIAAASIKKSDFGNDFLISVYKDDYVPALHLYADNSLLCIPKKYILKDTQLNGGTNYCYNIEKNGSLTLLCIEDFESNKGFKVNSGGFVNIESRSTVKLSNDKINNGGHISITANNIELKPGFTMQKGATLEVKNK